MAGHMRFPSINLPSISTFLASTLLCVGAIGVTDAQGPLYLRLASGA